jgi:hypothetical protein
VEQERGGRRARSLCQEEAGYIQGRIPEKVSVIDRATVTAGFAKEVDAVNQYAAVM